MIKGPRRGDGDNAGRAAAKAEAKGAEPCTEESSTRVATRATFGMQAGGTRAKPESACGSEFPAARAAPAVDVEPSATDRLS